MAFSFRAFLLFFFALLPFLLFSQQIKFKVKHVDERAAFSAKFPEKPDVKLSNTPSKSKEGKPITLTVSQTVYEADGRTFMVQSFNQAAGLSVNNDTLFLRSILNKLQKSFGMSGTIRTDRTDGLLTMNTSDTKDDSRIDIRLLQRGNRNYTMIAALEKEDEISARAFFDSFKLLPFQHEKKVMHQPAGEIYRVAVPPNYTSLTEPNNDPESDFTESNTFTAFDSLSGITYQINRLSYSPYLQTTVNDAGLSEEVNGNLRNGGYNFLRNEKKEGRGRDYWEIANTGNSSYNLACTFFGGRSLYELLVFLPSKKDILHAENFFDSFVFTENPPLDYLQTDKDAVLLADLISRDDELHEQAIAALNDYYFSENALPILYDYLKNKKFARDTTETLLLREFQYNRDARTVVFLTDYFAQTDNPNAQSQILNTLQAMQTEESLDAFFALAENWQKEEKESSYDYELSAFDSLDIFNARIDDLIKLYANPQFSYRVAMTVMNNTGTENQETILPHRDFFFNEARRIASENRVFELTEAADFADYYLFDALNIILTHSKPTPDIETYFKRFNEIADPYLVLGGIRFAAFNDLPLDVEMVRTAQSSPRQAVYLYRYAEDYYNGTDALPQEYATADQVVEAVAYNKLRSEYGELASYRPLKTEPYTIDGTDLVLHIFIFELEDYEGEYLGVVSQNATGAPSPYPYIYDYISEKWDEGKTEEMLNTMKANWEAED